MDSHIIKSSFRQLVIAQIFGIIVNSLNATIDTMITSLYLGSVAIAATGLFVPVVTFIGISYVFIIGFQILCSRAVGKGDRDRAVSLFSTGAIFLFLCSLIIALACIFFREPLAIFLGADDSILELLKNYIFGYAFGIPAQMLLGMLTTFLPLNSHTKLLYVSIAVMIVSNIALDIIFITVFGMGLFGLGLATAISYLLSFGTAVTSFFDKDNAIHFKAGCFSFTDLWHAAVLGLPNLMFTIGCTLKGYIMNYVLISHVGSPAVAVMAVQGNICAIVGAVPVGCANAFLSLGSIYYGERDKDSLLALIRYAFKLGLILSGSVTIILMLFSSEISDIFFNAPEAAFYISERMLLIFPDFLIFNTAFSILMRIYHCQGHTTLVNIFSLAENVLMALFSIAFINLIGEDSVWLSFPLSDIACLMTIALIVFVKNKCITFSIQKWSDLPEKFGADQKDIMNFTVASLEQVINISEKVVAFCREKGLSLRTSNAAGLAIEEMAGNILQHAFKEGKHIDIRIVNEEGTLTIRIRDDCPDFDPNKRMKQFQENPEDRAKNIGIRLISKISDEMIHQNNIGINTLIIKIKDRMLAK